MEKEENAVDLETYEIDSVKEKLNIDNKESEKSDIENAMLNEINKVEYVENKNEGKILKKMEDEEKSESIKKNIDDLVQIVDIAEISLYKEEEEEEKHGLDKEKTEEEINEYKTDAQILDLYNLEDKISVNIEKSKSEEDFINDVRPKLGESYSEYVEHDIGAGHLEGYTENHPESFFAQESAEGEDILNNLFTKAASQSQSAVTHTLSLSESSCKSDTTALSDQEQKRFDLLYRLRIANEKRKELLTQNKFYQSKLVEYFRMVKLKQTAGKKVVSEKESLMDYNSQYTRYSEILHGLMENLESSETKFENKIEKMNTISVSKTEQVNESTNKFQKYQEHVGLSALHSRTGNKLDPGVINDYLQTEMRKEEAIKDVRLNNLKIEHKNANLDKSLRSKEHFEGGLRLIDFEQLKIENQTFNEKVEDREESIKKLNKKITKCNHLLSHIKEKIDVTDKMKKSSRIKSKKMEKEFKQLQKLNNRSKKMRDNIKSNNNHLQMSCGLLGKKEYLRSYENTNDNTDNLRNKVLDMEREKSNLIKRDHKFIQEIRHYRDKKI